MGIIPATKILDADAPGFHLEVYLDGGNCSPLPLGGITGLAAVFSTIRTIPEFSKVERVITNIEPSTNIIIKTVNFSNDVSILFIFMSQILHYLIPNIFFQVYELQNIQSTAKPIFIAGTGLYELVKNERAIMAAATSYNANEVEESFNQMVASAVENYNVFMAELWIDPKPLEIDVLINFAQFFELIIDIKKTESVVESGTATTTNPPAVSVLPEKNPVAAEPAIAAPPSKKNKKVKE